MVSGELVRVRLRLDTPIAEEALRFLFVALFFCLAGAAAAEPTTVTSGPERVSLVELYTSEGCSSCPPADEALSELTDDEDLWRDIVPVAFHVTYWNDLGWEDRFAEAAFDSRQRAYAAQWGHDVVYTPGFVVDGREWRRSRIRPGIEAKALDDAQAGRLTAEYVNGEAEVRYTADQLSGVTAHAAVLGFGLTTDVKAGENANRTLHHDFVVLDHAKGALQANDEGTSVASLAVDRGGHDAERYAIAVWVEKAGQRGPIQAAGGWLAR